MERTIIQGIKRLRVLTPYDYDNMDELPHDLNNALDEACSRIPSTSRKGKQWRRRPKCNGGVDMLGSSLPKSSAVSEDSESSIDCRMHLQMNISENGQPKSDSDELNQKPQLSSWRQRATNVVESDSVNENFMPAPFHRRKRHFKRMSIDPPDFNVTGTSNAACGTTTMASPLSRPRRVKSIRLLKNKKITKSENGDRENMELEKPHVSVVCGKRKRSTREHSLEYYNCQERDKYLRGSGSYIGCDGTFGAHSWCGTEIASFSGSDYTVESAERQLKKSHLKEGSSSSVSESESDGLITNDEGLEADDEQSDFFHEPDQAYGIPGMTNWWDSEMLISDDTKEKFDARLQTILSGPLPHLSQSSKQSFHLNINGVSKMDGREIRAGRRRLDKSAVMVS